MALPQRKHSWQRTDTVQPSDPTVAVSYEEFFDEQEKTAPWCVDHGDTITVMSTRDIRSAVSSGDLCMSKKAWRDGNGCWLEIAEWPELTAGTEAPLALVVSNDDGPAWGSEDEFDIPESGIRRVRKFELDDSSGPAPHDRDVLRASSLMDAPSDLSSAVSMKAATLVFSLVLAAAGALAVAAQLSEPPRAAALAPMLPGLLAPLQIPVVAPAAYEPGQHPAASEIPPGFRRAARSR
jgi:hypothetical protein